MLLDTCVWSGVQKPLAAAGHDVTRVAEWLEDPGDLLILERAHRESRILVTLDKDFGELAVARGQPHVGIVRLVSLSTVQQAEQCVAVLEAYGAELQSGAIVTVELGRVRVRLPKASG